MEMLVSEEILVIFERMVMKANSRGYDSEGFC